MGCRLVKNTSRNDESLFERTRRRFSQEIPRATSVTSFLWMALSGGVHGETLTIAYTYVPIRGVFGI
jgi:hypothetical protein